MILVHTSFLWHPINDIDDMDNIDNIDNIDDISSHFVPLACYCK
jgi:hypothetical protein